MLTGSYGRSLRVHDVGPEVRAAIVAQVIDDVSSRRAVWSTWNLGAAALRSSLPLRMASPRDRLALTNELVTLAGDACVRIDDASEPERHRVGEEAYTSVELLTHLVAGQMADRLMTDLADDQREATKAVVVSTRCLDVLVGPAGSGKTTTLADLADAWRQIRGDVVGLVPSASAAATLGEALGVRCETAAKWTYESVGDGDGAAQRAVAYADQMAILQNPHPTYRERQDANNRRGALVATQHGWQFRRGDLVIVDEASMADTRTPRLSSTRPPRVTRRCCWSATTCNAGRSTPAVRSGCWPAAVRPPSCAPGDLV